MKTGLVVGKFAPLHKGHEFLLQKATDEADNLVVLVYDAPDVTGVPIFVRAGWVRALYPKAVIIEGVNPPPRDVWTPERTREHEEFIKHLVSPYHITHVFSSEAYGALLAQALGAEHVQIQKVTEGAGNLSATFIRNHPEARKFVSARVYHDMQNYGDVL
ncbi:MAG: hypothetical protein A3J55_03270 [Candidatus Ryanbacteria bacterium RIFCSPHIGHO2_02_FULL_45_17b]|uniref:Cytidyltransferase-like domain-containing protein n=1 Tax=Candidatus Ryanbacteria bacterium RIFCSPHIGHO2_01_FULL_45_22 TaxID=1802114 RepID=A0A1G2G306_9BACT|nr:MAG: hypothetical protein A2719_04470 [Candidatus Ryanbacteria bacterium RIFCSPHIGHO2_01_FULL_45_22]OGZ47482.1 MAG: hypothetical protein A3J55_03270 [Candidatus Ryanbacteria bacterium RIFCSPHIGHO2_02_FULL_45_17b]